MELKEIEKMKLEVVRDPKKFDYYTPEDEARFAELIKETGAVSLFLYSRNVLTKDGIKCLDERDKNVRTIARNGVMYAPVSFFRDLLGKKAESPDGFLPLVETCESLGIYAGTYNDGLLAIVGGEAIDSEIKKNPRLIYAGGYATLGKYDPYKFTSEDYRAAREKWRTSLVGTPEINDLSVPEIKEKIEAAEKCYEENLAKFNRDKNAIILFGDTPATLSGHLTSQYRMLESFATAWAMPGSKYYHDGAILSDILFGLEWMYENMYGEAEIEERGWRSAREFDWCDWFVPTPDYLTNIMLLLGDELPMEKRKTYLRCFQWVVTFMRLGYYQNCATSRIKVCTKAAILLEDPEWMENEFYDYDLLCEINEEGDGPHIDFTQWTHEYPYTIMYGNNNLSRVLFVGTLLGGTPVEYTSPKQYNLFKLAKYMFEPIHYRGRAAMIFAGRGAAYGGASEYGFGALTVAQLIPMLGLFGEDEDNYIKRLIKRNSIMPEVVQTVKNVCRIPELKIYLDILNDDSIPYESEYEIGHAYFTGDRAVQQRNGYAFTVALASDRHCSYESIDGANHIAWYTGDGAVYLSTKNDDHTFDCNNFVRNEKVMMNVPGTTVDTQVRIPWAHRVGIFGACDFVGTISSNEKYVTAAMDYKAYDYRGETVPSTDGEYGGGYLKHSNDLVAKKAYFLLDKECVCLGAGITSTTGFPVKTVVEDRNLVISDDRVIGKDRTAVDGQDLPVGDFGERLFDSPEFASLEDVGGYVFLEKTRVSVEKFTETEFHRYSNGKTVATTKYATPKRYFKVCIEHGENPKDATYAYATIPYATDTELEAYARCPEVEIISNTPECQALRKKSIGYTSYIFYKAGACEEIEVSEPCIVNIFENGKYREISVCDPTMKLDKITVRLEGKETLADSDNRVSVTVEDGTVIEIDTTHSVGRPYTARFTILDR